MGRSVDWRWVSVSKAFYSDNSAPVNRCIIDSLEHMKRSLGNSTQRTAVMIGHDHACTESLNLFLQVGGQVVLVALIEFFSRSPL